MLPSFRIRNYRVFDSIDIERLARVNLVVGKNNAGKTCLLEALRIYGDSGSKGCIRSVLRGRSEHRPGTLGDTEGEGGPHRDPIGRLFHGYQLPADSTAIELGPVNASPASGYSIQLSLAAFEVETHGDTTLERRVALEAADEETSIQFIVERKEPGADWTTIRRRKLGENPFTTVGRTILGRAPQQEPSNIPFVGTDAYDEVQMMGHWRRVAVRPSARAVVEDALRLIDPQIKEIVVLPSQRRGMIGEAVLIYSETKRLPLRSLGDGIQRLFQMMLAMVASPGGLVLIDEFENGLHWSIQRKAWNLLLSLSEELGVQVVATTHSWDCVMSFRDAMSARGQDEGLLLHIGRSARKSDLGAFVATHYDRQSLERVTQAGLEVR